MKNKTADSELVCGAYFKINLGGRVYFNEEKQRLDDMLHLQKMFEELGKLVFK